MNNRIKGDIYEERAREIFIKSGYQILEKNYRSKKGEIDFIAEKNGLIVFVEVKYRKNQNFGDGAEAVTREKLKKIYYTSQVYILEKNIRYSDLRYDLIVFTGEEFRWILDILRGDEIGCYVP